MFERFTDQARDVVVKAQEEARELKHNYIGTEHILLALLKTDLDLALNYEKTHSHVVNIVGYGEGGSGQAPITPRVKKIFELALREALQLGHNYIDKEHLALGLLRESEGVAARVIEALGFDQNDMYMEMKANIFKPSPQSWEEYETVNKAKSYDDLKERLENTKGYLEDIRSMITLADEQGNKDQKLNDLINMFINVLNGDEKVMEELEVMAELSRAAVKANKLFGGKNG